MGEKRVRCDKCGKDAKVVAIEGVLFPSDVTGRAQVVVIIECPECGRREQPDKPQFLKAK